MLETRVASVFGVNSAWPASNTTAALTFGEDSDPIACFIPKK